MTDETVPRGFAGVDWASETHQVCIVDAAGQILGEKAFAHGGAGLAELCQWPLGLTGGEPAAIAVAIEVPHGPVVETLLERGFSVHSVNPKQLDRFRDRFTVAGAKDDRRDAHVLADALRTDRPCFRRLRLADPVVIELREWSRLAEDLQQERNRLANRVREQLWRYYPQALRLGEDVAAEWFLALWRLAPTPAIAARLRASRVARVLTAHRIRRLEPDEALRLLRPPPLAVAPGTTEAAVAHIRMLAPRLTLVNRQIKDAHRRLDALCAALAGDGGEETAPEETAPGETAPGPPKEQRDAAILRSLPGVGRIVLATLLAEAWEPLQRRDYHALRALSGVAPVTKRSGKRCLVIMRRACQPRLRTAVYHWARTAIQHDDLSRRRYTELRRRGHSHGRALRTVGDRLLAVACAMLSQNTLFDPNRRHAQPKAA
jgi:transposase